MVLRPLNCSIGAHIPYNEPETGTLSCSYIIRTRLYLRDQERKKGFRVVSNDCEDSHEQFLSEKFEQIWGLIV